MQVRAARTRQALILAAAELIDVRGMKGTGLLDISRSAGVSKGALYFHFSSKDELVRALRQEARQSMLALADECLDGRTSTLAGAARFTTGMSRRMREDPVLRAGLRLESEGVTGELAGGPSLRETWMSVLRRSLVADASAGRLRDGADAGDTANLVAAVMVGLEALGREDESWWDSDVTIGVWQLLLRLAAPADGNASEVSRALEELRDSDEETAARAAGGYREPDGPPPGYHLAGAEPRVTLPRRPDPAPGAGLTPPDPRRRVAALAGATATAYDGGRVS